MKTSTSSPENSYGRPRSSRLLVGGFSPALLSASPFPSLGSSWTPLASAHHQEEGSERPPRPGPPAMFAVCLHAAEAPESQLDRKRAAPNSPVIRPQHPSVPVSLFPSLLHLQPDKDRVALCLIQFLFLSSARPVTDPHVPVLPPSVHPQQRTVIFLKLQCSLAQKIVTISLGPQNKPFHLLLWLSSIMFYLRAFSSKNYFIV